MSNVGSRERLIWAGESGRCAGMRRKSAHNVSTAEPTSFNDPDCDTESLLRPQQYAIITLDEVARLLC